MKILMTVVIIFCGLCSTIDSAFAQAWTQNSLPDDTWSAVASSADGSKLVLTEVPYGWIYTSTNSGASWISNSFPNVDWWSVASSADGEKIAVVGGGNFNPGPIYTSTNAGITWTSNSAPMALWTSIASSADGIKLVAVAAVNLVYTSSDSGTTWTSNTLPINTNQWLIVHSSAEGTKLVIAGSLGPVFTSTNSGVTWNAPVNAPSAAWQAIASSADGRKITMVGLTNLIYTSADYGATWQTNSVPGITSWTGIACSADGNKLVAVAPNVGIFISTNSGVTWTQDPYPFVIDPWGGQHFGSQLSIASSADGAKLVLIPGEVFQTFDNTTYATVYSDVIWISCSTPSPQVNIAPSGGNCILSWTVPSTNFVLQQNLDLTTAGWVTLTNTPTLNLTNLNDEVTVSPTNSSGFFRIVTQ